MTQIASAYEHLATKERDGSRIPDFVLGVLLPLPIAVPRIGLAANIVALGAVIALAFFRQPTERLPLWAPAIITGMIGWMGFSMVYNGLSTYQQLIYFAIWAVSILAFASGRIDRISICRGVGTGLVIGAVAGLASFFAGIGPDQYPGRLTGYVWNDPNQAGYYLSVLTAVAMVGIRPGPRRRVALLLLTACIVLTLSRTSIVAIGVGAIWFLLRRRLSPALGALLTAGAGYLLYDAFDRLKNWGPFAERVGSDFLRERIDAVANEMVQLQPWVGRGPGTSQIEVGGRTFFFHNAYLAVRNNGGWVLLGLLLLLIALTLYAMLKLPPAMHHPWQEAALIALLICALSLGEAFLRAPAALAIGLALRHAVNPMELRTFDQDDSPDHVF